MCKTRCASCLLPTEMDAELPHPRCSHLGIGNSCLAAGLQFTGLGSPQSRPIAACFVRSSGRVSPPHHISSDIVGACVLQHAPGQIMRQKTWSTLFDHSWFWPPVNTEQSKVRFSDPTTYFSFPYPFYSSHMITSHHSWPSRNVQLSTIEKLVDIIPLRCFKPRWRWLKSSLRWVLPLKACVDEVRWV